ncbi:hypothetical protein FGO68_gene7642 [Halteria grandinella]|uniref:Uncharacterized protein n=1 Tax=Halteria grandinella TaxID=5974 RepID=A0A8J8TAK6_HALGN|nr:hypothetical protein FGO68_gene7642 [Halteria grandinella]
MAFNPVGLQEQHKKIIESRRNPLSKLGENTSSHLRSGGVRAAPDSRDSLYRAAPLSNFHQRTRSHERDHYLPQPAMQHQQQQSSFSSAVMHQSMSYTRPASHSISMRRQFQPIVEAGGQASQRNLNGVQTHNDNNPEQAARIMSAPGGGHGARIQSRKPSNQVALVGSSQSEQVLINVLCNNISSATLLPENMNGGESTAQQNQDTYQRIFSADNSQHQQILRTTTNWNQPQFKIVAEHQSGSQYQYEEANNRGKQGNQSHQFHRRGVSAGVKGLIQRTLSSQNNCFLPNYRKPNMMKGYEEQHVLFGDKSAIESHFKPQQVKPHAQKVKRKNKKVDMTVANDTGHIVALNLQPLPQHMLLHNRAGHNISADIQEFLQPDFTQDNRVIKIQTATPLLLDPKSPDRDENTTPKKHSIPSPHIQAKTASLGVSGTQLNSFLNPGSQPNRVIITSTNSNAKLPGVVQEGEAPPQPLQGPTEETINNSSSNNQHYIHQQRLMMNSHQAPINIGDILPSVSAGIDRPQESPPPISEPSGMFPRQRTVSAMDRLKIIDYPEHQRQQIRANSRVGQQSPQKLMSDNNMLEQNKIQLRQIKGHIAEGVNRRRNQKSSLSNNSKKRNKTLLDKKGKHKTEWQVLNIVNLSISQNGLGKKAVHTSSHKQIMNNTGDQFNSRQSSKFFQFGGAVKESKSVSRPHSGSPSKKTGGSRMRLNNAAQNLDGLVIANTIHFEKTIPTPATALNQKELQVVVDDYQDMHQQDPIERYDEVIIMPPKNQEDQSKGTSLRDSNHHFMNIYGDDATLLSGQQIFSQTHKGGTINIIHSNQSSIIPQQNDTDGNKTIRLEEPKDLHPLLLPPTTQSVVIMSQTPNNLNSPLRQHRLSHQANNVRLHSPQGGARLSQQNFQLNIVGNEVNTHRSSTFAGTVTGYQEHVISFGIQVVSSGQQQVLHQHKQLVSREISTNVKKAKVAMSKQKGSPKRERQQSLNKRKSAAKNINAGMKKRNSTGKRAKKELSDSDGDLSPLQVEGANINVNSSMHMMRKSSSTHLKHLRNGSNGSGLGLIPAIMENMGLFDSGGTNDSNQQKGHFFENRYAPDDEVDLEQINSGSPGLKIYGDQFNLQQSRVNTNQQLPTVTPLQNPRYQEKVLIPMLSQDGNNRYLEISAELAHSLQQVNRQRASNLNQQQQVSMQDLTADDIQSLINLACGGQNGGEEVDPHLQAAAQAVLQQHFLQAEGNRVIASANGQVILKTNIAGGSTITQQSSTIDFSNQRSRVPNLPQSPTHQALSQKTLQQFILAKRIDQVYKTGQFKKYELNPYAHLHLRKQEEEERARNSLAQRQRQDDITRLSVMGKNIQAVVQQRASTLRDASENVNDIIYVLDDNGMVHELTATGKIPLHTLSNGDKTSELIMGGDAISQSDKNNVFQVTTNGTIPQGGPNTYLINRYNNSLTAIPLTLGRNDVVSLKQLLNNNTTQDDYAPATTTGNNRMMQISQEGMTLKGGSSYSVGQQAQMMEKSTARLKSGRDSNEVNLKPILYAGGTQEILHNHYTLDSNNNNKDLIAVQGGRDWKAAPFAAVKVSKVGSTSPSNERKGNLILMKDHQRSNEDYSDHDGSNKYFYQTMNPNNTSSLSPKQRSSRNDRSTVNPIVDKKDQLQLKRPSPNLDKINLTMQPPKQDDYHATTQRDSERERKALHQMLIHSQESAGPVSPSNRIKVDHSMLFIDNLRASGSPQH